MPHVEFGFGITLLLLGNERFISAVLVTHFKSLSFNDGAYSASKCDLGFRVSYNARRAKCPRTRYEVAQHKLTRISDRSGPGPHRAVSHGPTCVGPSRLQHASIMAKQI